MTYWDEVVPTWFVRVLGGGRRTGVAGSAPRPRGGEHQQQQQHLLVLAGPGSLVLAPWPRLPGPGSLAPAPWPWPPGPGSLAPAGPGLQSGIGLAVKSDHNRLPI